jgi:hypothetical protein
MCLSAWGRSERPQVEVLRCHAGHGLTKCTFDFSREDFGRKMWVLFREIYTHTDTPSGNTTPGIFVGGGSLFLIGRFTFSLRGKADSTNCELIIMWLACYQQGRREGERSEINAARSLHNPVGTGAANKWGGGQRAFWIAATRAIVAGTRPQ